MLKLLLKQKKRKTIIKQMWLAVLDSQPLGSEPKKLTIAPLRTCRLQRSSIGAIADQAKCSERNQAIPGNALPGRLEQTLWPSG